MGALIPDPSGTERHRHEHTRQKQVHNMPHSPKAREVGLAIHTSLPNLQDYTHTYTFEPHSGDSKRALASKERRGSGLYDTNMAGYDFNHDVPSGSDVSETEAISITKSNASANMYLYRDEQGRLGTPTGGCRNEISDFLKRLAAERKEAVKRKNLRECASANEECMSGAVTGTDGKRIYSGVVLKSALSKERPQTAGSGTDAIAHTPHSHRSRSISKVGMRRGLRKRSVTFMRPQTVTNASASASASIARDGTVLCRKRTRGKEADGLGRVVMNSVSRSLPEGLSRLGIDTDFLGTGEKENDDEEEYEDSATEYWIDTDRHLDFEHTPVGLRMGLDLEEQEPLDMEGERDEGDTKKLRVSTPTRRPSIEERMLINISTSESTELQKQVEAECAVQEMTEQSVDAFVKCAQEAQSARHMNGNKVSLAQQVIADHFWDRRLEGLKKYASTEGLDIGFVSMGQQDNIAKIVSESHAYSSRGVGNSMGYDYYADKKRRDEEEKRRKEKEKEQQEQQRREVSMKIDDAMRYHGKTVAFKVAVDAGNPSFLLEKPVTDFSGYLPQNSPRRRNAESGSKSKSGRSSQFGNLLQPPSSQPTSASRPPSASCSSDADTEFNHLNETPTTKMMGTIDTFNDTFHLGTFNDTFVVCESPIAGSGMRRGMGMGVGGGIAGLDKVDTDTMLDYKLNLVAEMMTGTGSGAMPSNLVYSGRGLSSKAGADQFAPNSTDPNRLKLQPTRAHYVLTTLEKAGFLDGGWVQPCPDRLAQKAGFPQNKLVEVFGAWGDAKNPALSVPQGMQSSLQYPPAVSRAFVEKRKTKAGISTTWTVENKFDEAVEHMGNGRGVCLCVGSSLGGSVADEVALAAANATANAVREDGSRSTSTGTGSEFGNLVVISGKPTAQDHKAAVRVWGKPDEVLCLLAEKLFAIQKQELNLAEAQTAGARWSSRYPHCNYHTGDAY